jgi:hypothetical protein
VVVVARPDALELAEREGLDGFDAALSELLARAGMSAPEAEGAESPMTGTEGHAA